MTEVPQLRQTLKAPAILRLFQLALWLSVLGLIGYYSFKDVIFAALAPPPAAMEPSKTGALAPGMPLNAPFKLVHEDGVAVTEGDFAGTPGAWFYGFTSCPDICPTALLLDAAGRFVGTPDPEEPPQAKLGKLRRLVADAKA